MMLQFGGLWNKQDLQTRSLQIEKNIIYNFILIIRNHLRSIMINNIFKYNN